MPGAETSIKHGEDWPAHGASTPRGTGGVHLIWALRQRRQGLGPGSNVLLLLFHSRLQLGSDIVPQSLKLGVGARNLFNQLLHLLLGLHMLRLSA